MAVSTALVVSLAVLALVLPPCPVASAPTITNDAFSKVPHFCIPFLRKSNGTRIMREDIASYYRHLHCPFHSELAEAFSVSQMGREKLQLAIRQKKDASICHGVVEVLSLIDAYNWTREMCDSSTLTSDVFSQGFCDSYDNAKVHMQGITLAYRFLGYHRLAAVANFLGNLQDCEKYCGKGTDSAFCSTFKEASSFLTRKYEQAEEDGGEETKVDEIPELGSAEATPSTSPLPTDPDVNVQPTTPLLSSEIIERLKNNPDLFEKLFPDTQRPGSSTLPSMPVRTPSDSNTTSTSPPVGTASSWSSPSPTEGNTESIVATTTQQSEATTLTQSTETPEEPSPSTEKPPSSEETEFTGVIDNEGGEGRGADSKNSDTYYGDDDDDIPGGFLLGDSNADLEDEIEEELEEEYEEELEAEYEARLELEKENAKKGEKDDKKGGLSSQAPLEGGGFVGQEVEQSDSSGGSGSSKRQSYGAWHFFTIFLFLAVAAIIGYLLVHNRKRIREGVSSYVSDKKRRRRGREYKPLIG